MKITFEIKEEISNNQKNNITFRIASISSAMIWSINSFQIRVDTVEANKVLKILDEENIKYEKTQ